jgi:hypothetical protein
MKKVQIAGLEVNLLENVLKLVPIWMQWHRNVGISCDEARALEFINGDARVILEILNKWRNGISGHHLVQTVGDVRHTAPVLAHLLRRAMRRDGLLTGWSIFKHRITKEGIEVLEMLRSAGAGEVENQR